MEVAMCEEATEHKLFPSRSSELFRGFYGGFVPSGDDLVEEDSDEIDLGLSLGGCFSSGDSRRKGIARSSSIPSNFPSGLRSGIALSRVSSLPGETGEGMWGKEMDCIGGAERKRKGIDGDLEGGFMAKIRKVEVPNGGSCELSPVSSSWIARDMMPEKFVPPASQGSNVSQGSSSSGGSELESRPKQGFNNGSEVRRKMAERKNDETPSSPSAMPRSKRVKGTAIATVGGHPRRKNDGGRGGDGGMLAEEMPLVSTRGDGRNGRRIQGFLYKCGNGEVRIVCVCHGSFLTPAEFVKHGGGGDVANPLKHIIVNPSPPFL